MNNNRRTIDVMPINLSARYQPCTPPNLRVVVGTSQLCQTFSSGFYYSVMASVGDSASAATRNPKCTRCRNHGLLNDLKGHKHSCEFRYCNCDKCLIMSEKQQSTAKRIALYRQQLTGSSETANARRSSTDETKSPHYSRPVTPEFVTSERRAVATEIHWQNVRILLYIFPSLDSKVLSDLLEDNRGNMFVTVLAIAKATMNQADHYISQLNQEATEYYQNGKDKRLSEADRLTASPYAIDSNANIARQSLSPLRTPDSAYNSDSSVPLKSNNDGRKRPHPTSASTTTQQMESEGVKSVPLMCNYCRLDLERNAQFCSNCGKPQ